MEFDLIVIGAGAAGLVSSGFAARLGLKVALISDGHPGGECLWTGCVPSKTLIRSAQVAHLMAESTRYGVPDGHHSCAFDDVMVRMRRVRERISHHDSKETIEKSGVKVFMGRARFVAVDSVEVDGHRMSARKFIIATGASPVIPPVEGLIEVGPLTHETILDIDSRPEHLLVLGGGPVGVEYGQAFLRYGSNVSIVEMDARLLSNEDKITSDFVAEILRAEGAQLYLKHKAVKAQKSGDTITLTLEGPESSEQISGDAVLVAAGKRANTGDLNLNLVGVETEKGYIKVNSHQRTSAGHVWACGDVCVGAKFTHYADHQARIAVMNACLGLPARREEIVLPWCTYTEPEIASVGRREEEARLYAGEDNFIVLHYDLGDFDRAIIEGTDRGFVRIYADRGGAILGGTIAAERAGEMIHELSLAMRRKAKVQDLAQMMHVYPTMSCAIGNCAAQFYAQAASGGWTSRLLKWWVSLIK